MTNLADVPARRPAWSPGTVAESIALWLMEKEGVAAFHVASRLAELLGEERGLIYRRLKEQPGFSNDEIATIATALHTSPDMLSRYRGKELEMANSGPGVIASTFDALPCSISPGLDLRKLSSYFVPAADPGAPTELVACMVDGRWEICAREDAPSGKEMRAVDSVLIRRLGCKIAVVEDNEDAANSLAEALSASGLSPSIFSSLEGFVDAYRTGQRFDAYLLDWMLGNRDATMLVTVIRSMQPVVPIFVLSGRIADFGAMPLTDFCMLHNIELQSKPFQMGLLVQQVQRAIGAGTRSPA